MNSGHVTQKLFGQISCRDSSISIIRIISTALIVFCHFLQYYDLELAWWLNVGVQIFLFMSGYLYANKNEVYNDVPFLKRQFIKILVDYYIVVIPVIVLYSAFIPSEISVSKALKVLLTYDNLGGGSIHLWYVPYCLFCYLITPLLSRVMDVVFDRRHVVLSFLFIELVIYLLTWTFFGYFDCAWLSCYILGFFVRRLEDSETRRKEYRVFVFLLILLAVVCNLIQITLDYILQIRISDGLVLTQYKILCDYFHVFLGASIFIVFRAFCLRFRVKSISEKAKAFFSVSDRLSYDVYLVHMFFIMGPFSLMQLTDSELLNMVLAVIATLVSAFAVNLLSDQVKKRLLNIQ